jgi:hypothetical protein
MAESRAAETGSAAVDLRCFPERNALSLSPARRVIVPLSRRPSHA